MGLPGPEAPLHVIDEARAVCLVGVESDVAIKVDNNSSSTFFGLFDGYFGVNGSLQRNFIRDANNESGTQLAIEQRLTTKYTSGSRVALMISAISIYRSLILSAYHRVNMKSNDHEVESVMSRNLSRGNHGLKRGSFIMCTAAVISWI